MAQLHVIAADLVAAIVGRNDFTGLGVRAVNAAWHFSSARSTGGGKHLL